MKNLIRTLGAVALATVVGTGCGTKADKGGDAADSLKKIDVKTFTVHTETIGQVAEFTGNIEANQVNNIGPNQPGRIDKILVDVGATVSKGQLLVTMDPTAYNQASVQLANLEADYNRLKSVFDAGGVSRQQLDQTETQLRVSREQVRNLKENIELRSPVSGVVTARNMDPGDVYAGAGGILTVMQINPLKVTMYISEQYFPLVKKGMGVDLDVDLFPGEEFRGNVSLISPAISPATRTFMVEVSIPNQSLKLRPGMYCRSTINLGTKEGIMLSDLAIQKQIGTAERYVYVIENGAAVRRTVTLGRQAGQRYDILTGLQDGDQVVVAGASHLSDGVEVNVVE